MSTLRDMSFFGGTKRARDINNSEDASFQIKRTTLRPKEKQTREWPLATKVGEYIMVKKFFLEGGCVPPNGLHPFTHDTCEIRKVDVDNLRPMLVTKYVKATTEAGSTENKSGKSSQAMVPVDDKIMRVLYIMQNNRVEAGLLFSEQTDAIYIEMVCSRVHHGGEALIAEAEDYGRSIGKRYLRLRSLHYVFAKDENECESMRSGSKTTKGLKPYYESLGLPPEGDGDGDSINGYPMVKVIKP